MKPIIETEDLSVIYNFGKTSESRAIEGVNIKIYPQEYIVLYGASGSGKSTLLYSIAGLQPPTRGRIHVLGKDISGFNSLEMAQFHQSEIGMIFQNYNIIPTLSVLDNVALPQVFQGIDRKIRFKRAEELLERFGILAHAKKLPLELSGGQQQRVGIARSLINDPQILLADEPVGNLDSKSAQNVLTILKQLNKDEKRTIILVTHNPQCLDYADRVFHMKDGKVLREVFVVEEMKKKQEVKQDKSEQGGFSSSLEQLAMIYPQLPEIKLKSKALTNYLLNSLSVQEVVRLEKTIESYLQGNIKEEELTTFLHKPFEEGGVGLYRQTALNFSDKLKTIVSEANLFHKESADSSSQESDSIDTKVEELRKSLLDSYHGKLTEEHIERLERFIKERLLNVIDRKEFKKLLGAPLKDGGLGFSWRTTRNLAMKLEMVFIL
jgi:putative ABC transport system ATP-binding protein